MSDTCPSCGSDDKKVRVPTLVNTEGHCSCHGNTACVVRAECVMDGLGRCPDSWHDEQPTTPEDWELALGRMDDYENYNGGLHSFDSFDADSFYQDIATLRAHIEALTVERDEAVSVKAQSVLAERYQDALIEVTDYLRQNADHRVWESFLVLDARLVSVHRERDEAYRSGYAEGFADGSRMPDDGSGDDV